MATKNSRAKLRKAKKPSRATVRSTSGVGFDFEDQVGAEILLSMLLGEPLPSMGDDVSGNRLQSQVGALGWSLDDLLATGEDGDGVRQLAISCKSNPQVSVNGLPAQFVTTAWEQWSKQGENPFKRDHDGLMLVTRGSNARFQQLWTNVKTACSGEPALAVARLSSTAAHRRVLKSISTAIRAQTPSTSDSEIVSFINHLHVHQTDFQHANSQSKRTSIGRCRVLLEDGKPTEAKELWKALVDLVREARIGHGTVAIDQAWATLRGKFRLVDNPDYRSDWQALDALSAQYRVRIETSLHSDISLARREEAKALAALIANENPIVVFGESGTGKSALVKAVLDAEFSDWKQIWLGPEEFSGVSNPALRRNYGVLHALAPTLKAASSSQNILILDSAERLDDHNRANARSLIAELLNNNASSATTWRIVVVGQTESWADRRLQKVAGTASPKSHGVKPLSSSEVYEVLRAIPRLTWATLHTDIIQALANLRTLAWVLEAETQFAAEDPAALSSHIAIAEYVWRHWTEGKAKYQRLLMQLAVREANFEHSFAVSELEAADADAIDTGHNLPLRRGQLGRIEFQHDLASEWARFQKLKENAVSPDTWAAHASNPLWTGALRMLGGFLLRQRVNDRSGWDVAFETVSGQSKSGAADTLLDALCLDPLADTFLAERADLLFRDNGRLLVRLLKRFLHIATAPGNASQAMAEVLDAEPSFALYIEAQYRTPIVGRWPAVARFLHTNRERVADLTLPVVSQVCERWLTALPVLYGGNPAPLRREFAEVALANARALQLEELKHTMMIGDGREQIYSAALAAAPDLPDEVCEWALEMAHRRPVKQELRLKVALHSAERAKQHKERLETDPEYRERHERREHASFVSISSPRSLPPWPLGPKGRVSHEFQAICTGPNGLVPLISTRPEIAAEVLIASMIEGEPKEDHGSSYRFHEGVGLAHSQNSYPTGFWKSVVFSFLRINSAVALDALVKLVNFCTERWREDFERAFGEKPQPLCVALNDGGEREYFGGGRLFDWFQSNSHFAGQLQSALAALERWLCLEIEASNDISIALEKLLRECDSSAILGVLISVGKFRPELFLSALKPLTLVPGPYRWDQARAEHLSMNFAAGQLAPQGDVIFNMARDWHFAPHHKETLLSTISSLIRANPALAQAVNSAAAKWVLPSDQKQSIEQRILAAQLDAANYTETAEGIEFYYPEDLRREIETFQESNAPTLRALFLPDRCRSALQQSPELSDDVAMTLFGLIGEISADAELEEDSKSTARIALACTLLVKASAWLKQNQEANDLAEALLADALSDSDDEDRRFYGHGEFEFVAHAVFAKWICGSDDAAPKAVLRLISSGSAIGVRTFFALAHSNKERLGARWRRLVQIALLWAGLSILRPRYDGKSDEVSRWRSWRERFRNFSLDNESSLDDFDPVDIAQRVEQLEKIRWRRGSDTWRSADRTSTGLDWSFLADAFSWLELDDTTEVSPADLEERKKITLALWKFEIWHSYRTERERDAPPPSQLGYKLVEYLAKMVAKSDGAKARELWQPVFDIGPYGHYAFNQFLLCWFMETSRLQPHEFTMRWRPMMEYALSRRDWLSGSSWHYGQSLLRQILGFSAKLWLDKKPEFQAFALEARPIYKGWAREHLDDDDSLEAFSLFLASSYARLLRLDGLIWIKEAFHTKSGVARWFRPETGTALLDFLNVLLNEDSATLRTNTAARDAFLELVGILVAKQVHAALALQERARQMLLR